MKTLSIAVLLTSLLFLVGCSFSGSSPVLSDGKTGKISVHVRTLENGMARPVRNAELYLDNNLIGVSDVFNLVDVKRGSRKFRVEAPGYQSYKRTLKVLGDRNPQTLNIILEK